MNRVRRIAFALGAAALPMTASACGVCGCAIVDAIAPPFWLWPMLGASWFLSTAMVSSGFDQTLPFHPRMKGAVQALAVAAGIGLVAAGPLPILVLALLPVGIFLNALLASRSPRARWQRALLAVGLVHCIAIAGAAVVSERARHAMTTEGFMVKWSGTSVVHVMTKGLERREPESLPTYRYLVEHGRGLVLGDAAERLAVIGDPLADADLLRSAIARTGSDAWTHSRLENALADLQRRRP